MPIVSESFLRDINPRIKLPINASFDELNNEDYFSNNSNNQYIYQLVLNELKQNNFLNFRVRPVMVPDMNRRLLKNELLLTNSYQLWGKVSNFISMLKKTKQFLKKTTA